MEALTACTVGGRLTLRFPSAPQKRRSSHCRPLHFLTRASREGPELDRWDQMELKFGKLLGEDPKLTLAKIMARKANPNVSYLEVEKSFTKNKGKLDDIMFNIPTDMNVEGKPSDSLNSSNLNMRRQNLPKDINLNLSRPVMNKAGKTSAELNLSRPVLRKGMATIKPVEKPVLIKSPKEQLPPNNDNRSETLNVALRKPAAIQEDDIEPKMKIKPNIYLKMRKDNETLSDVSLQKKPEVIQKTLNPDQENMSSGDPVQSRSGQVKSLNQAVKPLRPTEMLNNRLEMTSAIEISAKFQNHTSSESIIDSAINAASHANEGFSDTVSDSLTKSSEVDDDSEGFSGLQSPVQWDVESHDVEASSSLVDENLGSSNNDVPRQASLLGKPLRLDSSAKEVLRPTEEVPAYLNEEVQSTSTDVGNILSVAQEEREGNDWKRAEHMLRSGERAEVELVSCSGRGFVVSFGSLVGFLPYRNLGAKWKFLAFESWLRKKGLDPTLYRQNLSIIGNYDMANKNLNLGSQEMGKKDEDFATPNTKFEDLLNAYDQEKAKFLSSFVGQRIKVSVVLADRNSRRLMFSGRPKEKEELVEKKRNLMAKLSVGDVVKCCIKKITYFGIFVEVEGVPALVHQSEVSWDATLDPSSCYKIGQIVEAKVHQLDFALERITLSLKEIVPDPLMEALESVVGDRSSLGESLETAQADIEEWADVESLIEELQQIDGVQSVSKGRYFLSPGLAPTFQVYMASVFDNQYKLLARYGNKVQEVVVQASLDKEQMKGAILTCTNRVK